VKKLLHFSLFIAGGFLSAQDFHPYFLVDHIESSKKINLNLSTKSGICYIIPSGSTEPLKIMGLTENDAATSSFWKETIGDTKYIKVDLRHKNESSTVSRMISQSFFSNPEPSENWHVYLSKSHPLSLSLHHIVGTAFIDLSGLSIEKLKVISASANVHFSNKDKILNKLEMDTFSVKVEFGSVKIKDLHLANVSTVLANVGFGNLTIDFEQGWNRSGNINASVAAGSMDIMIPQNSIPIKITVQDSPLCSVKTLPNFKKISKNVFVSENYQADAPNILNFLIDVGMGSITFHQK
jgi:hypothetical protein